MGAMGYSGYSRLALQAACGCVACLVAVVGRCQPWAWRSCVSSTGRHGAVRGPRCAARQLRVAGVSRMSVMLWGVLGTKLDKLCPDLRVIGVATSIQLGLRVIGAATGARSFC